MGEYIHPSNTQNSNWCDKQKENGSHKDEQQENKR